MSSKIGTSVSAQARAQEISAALQETYNRLRQNKSDKSMHQEAFRLLQKTTALELLEQKASFLTHLMTILLTRNFIRHQAIASYALTLLKHQYRVTALMDKTDGPLLMDTMSEDTLLLATLKRIINNDLEFEPLLCALRSRLLLDYRYPQDFPKAWIPLVAALAEQCFNNEFIFWESEDEQAAVIRLEQTLMQCNPQQGIGEAEIILLLLAMYRPLNLNPLARQITTDLLSHFSPASLATFEKILYEPLEEERLTHKIPSFGNMACETSQAVRAQYETNPYPRWFELSTPPSLDKILTKTDPAFAWPASFKHKEFSILVPGCGTGQQPISIAASNPDAHVLALDISKSSLAYAKRMALKLGIENISFLHGDLLDITTLGQYFHHIDCIGVLHHLKEPFLGWQALNKVLLPGGTLNISVYGRASRLHLQPIHNEIGRLDIPATQEAMKNFRHQLLTQEQYRPLLPLIRHNDLFYLSGFRDALFHVCEHQYSITKIQETIEYFNYRFLGFKAMSLRKTYCNLFPDDPGMNSFANWKKFEPYYTGSGNMFSMLLQKQQAG